MSSPPLNMSIQLQKLVVVIGATGGQGYSVINRFLTSSSYRLRGTTRNLKGPKALALAEKGVEMVTADLNDVKSLEDAFQDANVIFAYTNFFEAFATSGPEVAMRVEYAQGVNLARAASATLSLEHYIWSTLPDRGFISRGKWAVPHCDSKAKVDTFIKQDAALLAKTTFLWAAFFAETMQHPMFVPNILLSAGKHVWLQPASATTPVFSLGDHTINIGKFVYAIITQPNLTLPSASEPIKYVFAFAETTSLGKMLQDWGEVAGKPTEYIEISLEAYDRLWPMWGLEVGKDLGCWGELGVESWGSEKWIGKEELGLGEELVGFRDTLAGFLESPRH